MSTVTQLDRFEIDYMMRVIAACLDAIAAHDKADGEGRVIVLGDVAANGAEPKPDRVIVLGDVAAMCAEAVSKADRVPKGVQKAPVVAWLYVVSMVTSEKTRLAFRKVNRLVVTSDGGLIARVDVGSGQLREVRVRTEGRDGK
jgi:hypothetical protein